MKRPVVNHTCTDACTDPSKAVPYYPPFEMSEHVRSYNGDGVCWCGHWHEETEFELGQSG